MTFARLFSFPLFAAAAVTLSAGAAEQPPAKSASGAPPKSEISPKADVADLAALRAKAERGNAIAQYNLGLAYVQGRQTRPDPIEAFIWLTLAAEGGSTGKALETVLNTMSTDELTEGRRRLEILRANNPFLRPTASATTPKSPSPSAAPSTSTPATSASVPSGPPPVAPVPEESKHLHEQLTAAGLEREQLATQLGNARTEIERLKSQLRMRAAQNAELAPLQPALKEATAALAAQSTELAARRVDAESLRIELNRTQAQLASARDTLAANEATATVASEPGAAVEPAPPAGTATPAAHTPELTAARRLGSTLMRRGYDPR